MNTPKSLEEIAIAAVKNYWLFIGDKSQTGFGIMRESEGVLAGLCAAVGAKLVARWIVNADLLMPAALAVAEKEARQ